ncbi:DoxX family membrane protein [Streptomyces sp. NBC_01244]|uniref:DoxX family membrane protein n=1 Tax=Streptomyces sp. NBC_01244 TaxID=2903797 RepID=UPI002E154970|nr:DoxX family membrane protein [Streptomyces sp. NBC_01244]
MTRTTRLRERIRRTSEAFASTYQRRSPAVLRISVGVLFLWFGMLKFSPAMSPAEDIAIHAMSVMTFDAVPPEVTRPLLAVMEVAIGLGLVTGVLLRLALTVFFVHMAGVFATLVLLPDEVWSTMPFVPTMDGQYIIKNIVLIAACLTVATAHVQVRPSSDDIQAEPLVMPAESGEGAAASQPVAAGTGVR